MSAIVYRMARLLQRVLVSVPIGTNLGLLCTLLSGRLLLSRGALFPALSDFGLNPAEVRRCEAALAYGRFDTDQLLADWLQCVLSEFPRTSDTGFGSSLSTMLPNGDLQNTLNVLACITKRWQLLVQERRMGIQGQPSDTLPTERG